METVTSADGTNIAFDCHVGGDAGTVILIGGAFSYRALPAKPETSSMGP